MARGRMDHQQRAIWVAGGVALVALLAAGTASAQPLSIRNSFRVGDSGVLCSAQVTPADKRLNGLFDRAYKLTCRDAAGSVGSVIAVRRALDPADPALGIAKGPADLQCGPRQSAPVDGLGAVDAVTCQSVSQSVDYRRYVLRRGDTSYLAEGLAGYDPVLRLALASIVNDRPQKGTVQVASTQVVDAAAFARVQAGALDSEGARTEAYVRNNDGRFAESAEFFEVLSSRPEEQSRRAELMANAGLQQSNLGNFASAYALFLRAEKEMARSDVVTQRLLRNYRAINLLNQRFADAALTVLDAPVGTVDQDYDVRSAREGVVSDTLSEQINRENGQLQMLGGIDSGLSPSERAATLDAQANQLRGAALLQMGDLTKAEKALATADHDLLAIRNGRVVSIRWLRAQIALELANIAEAQGKMDAASGRYADAVNILSGTYPESPALLSARARQAGFMVRNGDKAGARTLFAQVVDDSGKVSDSSAALRDLLSPYFALLVEANDAAAASDMFKASQLLQRPGVAGTQAVLARQLSEGDDEAAALFRLSVARTREIVRTEVEIGRLSAITAPTPAESARLAASRDTLSVLRDEQTRITAQLSKFPRYKVLSASTASLEELQGALRDGEAYYKVSIIGDAAYALYIEKGMAQIFRLDRDRAALEQSVGQLRDSIVRIENGQVTTYPFDIETARALYVTLFGPVTARVEQVSDLVFEPDGPLLQIPPAILVTDDASVARYKARVAKPNGDDFDFTGTAWLGRNRRTSIAVSPRSFLDVRTIAPSRAKMAYLGVGGNAVPTAFPAGEGSDSCDWPLGTWQNPINTAELKLAQSYMGAGRSKLMVGTDFTDTKLMGDGDLSNYRILHFATHGLVTAPRPQCPARPALVTSFGPAGSDGLLSFKEIFDLRLDADLVILSACDTAGMATVAASREAGVRTGGNYALDGLVRAFVGAGARSVIASHWPVPDDYNATNRLIGGLFGGKPGQSIGELLDQAQVKLMDDKNTSHPFYWAAFVILGDGEKPLIRR